MFLLNIKKSELAKDTSGKNRKHNFWMHDDLKYVRKFIYEQQRGP